MEAREAVNAINAEFRKHTTGETRRRFLPSMLRMPLYWRPTSQRFAGSEPSFREGIKEIGGKMRIEPVEIRAAGDVAYQWANYSTKGGKRSVTGKFIEIYNRQADGSWKIRLTIYNTDHPLSGGN